MKRVLSVRDLQVSFPGDEVLTPVRGVSFDIDAHEIVGLAGESGSGKTLTTLALAQLLPSDAEMTAQRLQLHGESLLGPGDRDRRRLLGTELAMVFQDPMGSLNPARRLGPQMAESVRSHRGASRRGARTLAAQHLDELGFTAPERRLRQYPHELSGGMRQRAIIAMGMMPTPSLMIADEPTTALDVTVQAQVMRQLCDLNRTHGTSILLVSHDIALLSEVCDRIMIMYGGRIVEDLAANRLLTDATHPYTQALLGSVPRSDVPKGLPLTVIPGAPEQLTDRGRGCPFQPRCGAAIDRCSIDDPDQREIAPGHRCACWLTRGEEMRRAES